MPAAINTGCFRHCEFHTGQGGQPFWMKARTAVIASAAMIA
jgi:hypothetical protein